jgi:hypothetical protein
MAYEPSDDVQSVATGSEDGAIGAEQGLNPRTASSMTTPRQNLLWRMAVVLANVDYFEELSARLQTGATSGKEAVVLTQNDLTNLRKLVEIGLIILKDQLESGFSSATKEA